MSIEERRHFQDEKLAAIEVEIQRTREEIHVIFELLNNKIMPQIYTIPFLTKGFWIMAISIISLTGWLFKETIIKK